MSFGAAPGPPTILVVDDDVVDVRAICRALRRTRGSCSVESVSDGASALARLRETPPNGTAAVQPFVVVLDLSMPRMDGFEFLDELRADPRLRHTPVFVLSTSDDESDRRRAYARNVAGYLRKGAAGSGADEVAELLQRYARTVLFPPANQER